MFFGLFFGENKDDFKNPVCLWGICFWQKPYTCLKHTFNRVLHMCMCKNGNTRNSTGSEQYEISSTGIKIQSIRCSWCKRIPDMQIFNCLNGHLICDICKPENDICSRNECTEVLMRSTVAERLLAEITFKCPWTNFGCNETSIRRDQLTLHKKICNKK